MLVRSGMTVPHEVLHFEDQNGRKWTVVAGGDIIITHDDDCATVTWAGEPGDGLLRLNTGWEDGLTLTPRPMKRLDVICSGSLSITSDMGGEATPRALPRLSGVREPYDPLSEAISSIASEGGFRPAFVQPI